MSLIEEVSRESDMRKIGTVSRDNFHRVFSKRAEKLDSILRKMQNPRNFSFFNKENIIAYFILVVIFFGREEKINNAGDGSNNCQRDGLEQAMGDGIQCMGGEPDVRSTICLQKQERIQGVREHTQNFNRNSSCRFILLHIQ